MNQYQFQAPRLTAVNKTILIATAALFLLHSILNAVGAFSLLSFLGLSGAGIESGFVFQFLTYPFMETQLMSVIFNSLLVWFIGSELETLWGRKVYLRFLLLIVLGVGIFYFLVNLLFFHGTHIYETSLHGLNGINFALLIAYATLYPERQLSLMMIFPMKARTFCWILAGIEAYMALFSNITSSWAHLLAMGLSWLIIHFSRTPFLHKVLNQEFQRAKPKKGHLYVVKDDDQKPPKYWQ
jgi:membrane associated rhomboid family serine protease